MLRNLAKIFNITTKFSATQALSPNPAYFPFCPTVHCGTQCGSFVRVVSHNVEQLPMFYKVFILFFPRCGTFVHVVGHNTGHCVPQCRQIHTTGSKFLKILTALMSFQKNILKKGEMDTLALHPRV
jgi:hypothetical protein